MPRRIDTRARYVRSSHPLTHPDAGAAWMGDSLPVVWVGTDTPGGVAPTFRQKLSAVGRATGLIADTLAGVPWHVYRGRDRLQTPRWVADPQNAQGDGRTAGAPSLALTGVQFWAGVIVDMLHWGEAVIVYRGPLASAILHPVHPSDVEDISPVLGAKIGGQWTANTGWHVIHLRGRAPYWRTDSGGYRGIGVLTRHATSLGIAADVDTYAANTFRSGLPYGYLSATAPMSAQQADDLAARWMAKHGDRRQIAVVGGAKFEPINLSPVDAELIRMQDFTLREIAHAFGMSAHYLDVSGGGDTYANVQDRQLDFRQLTLLPWARLIESELDTRLPVGTTLKLRLDGLERGSTSTRYADYTRALDPVTGWMTRDEVRDLENLPPQTDEGNQQ